MLVSLFSYWHDRRRAYLRAHTTPPQTFSGRRFLCGGPLMADSDRAQQSLAQNITAAHEQLKKAREDGACDQIMFWAARLDELVDRLPRKDRTNA